MFENPNQIDLARTGNRHCSFGLGIHRPRSGPARGSARAWPRPIAAMQRACAEQRLAEPVTVRKAAADLGL